MKSKNELGDDCWKTKHCTPWSVTVGVATGLMSLAACRALFRQTRTTAFLQSYIVITAALAAMEQAGLAESREKPKHHPSAGAERAH